MEEHQVLSDSNKIHYSLDNLNQMEISSFFSLDDKINLKQIHIFQERLWLKYPEDDYRGMNRDDNKTTNRQDISEPTLVLLYTPV